MVTLPTSVSDGLGTLVDIYRTMGAKFVSVVTSSLLDEIQPLILIALTFSIFGIGWRMARGHADPWDVLKKALEWGVCLYLSSTGLVYNATVVAWVNNLIDALVYTIVSAPLSTIVKIDPNKNTLDMTLTLGWQLVGVLGDTISNVSGFWATFWWVVLLVIFLIVLFCVLVVGLWQIVQAYFYLDIYFVFLCVGIAVAPGPGGFKEFARQVVHGMAGQVLSIVIIFTALKFNLSIWDVYIAKVSLVMNDATKMAGAAFLAAVTGAVAVGCLWNAPKISQSMTGSLAMTHQTPLQTLNTLSKTAQTLVGGALSTAALAAGAVWALRPSNLVNAGRGLSDVLGSVREGVGRERDAARDIYRGAVDRAHRVFGDRKQPEDFPQFRDDDPPNHPGGHGGGHGGAHDHDNTDHDGSDHDGNDHDGDPSGNDGPSE